MNEMKKIGLFLDAREKRVYHQEELLRSLKGLALATVRVNYPGIDKSNYITDSIGKIICDEISIFHKKEIIFSEEYKSEEGYIGHFIFSVDYKFIKKSMIDLEENHILGRCVDLDVYYLDKNEKFGFEEIKGASRSDLNLPPRKCFICQEEARICSRAQSHTIEEIKEFFEVKFNQYEKWNSKRQQLSYELSQYALKAMVEEVSTMPSFGLVSPSTKGSHKDMDFYTFMDSSFAIAPFLKEMAAAGYTYHYEKEIFKAIRPIGIRCEEAMFKATKGVNTHKGMIFLLGIVITATAKALYEGNSFERIENIIRNMCFEILDDFKEVNNKEILTHGEKLYKEFGFTGIRGEVKAGIPVVFKAVLPDFLSSDLKGHELFAHTLLELMARVEDSTIVHRQGIDKLKEIQREVKVILENGGFNSSCGRKMALDFEEKCIEENVSPGGAADLLALIIFLSEIYNKYYK
ncbi:MAG: triphosphoribosyl-dephospho-CoA synthase CitG [Clostridium sp.]